MANITLYKHGDMKIYLELLADDSYIGFKELGGIPISKEYRHINDEDFNKMAKELKELIDKLNDTTKSEKELVELYIDFIAYWDDHCLTYIISDDNINQYVDKDGKIYDEAYVFKLNGFYIYDEV